MSAFREVGGDYDAIEWLPNDAPTSQRESPEQLTIPPRQTGLYTSVGSRAPAITQQFTAPNRIQRDGTGRRAQHFNMQGRGHDSHFGNRNMNQHFGRSNFTSGADTSASQANIPSGLTGGLSAPTMYSGNVPFNRRDMVRRGNPSLNPLAEAFNMEKPDEIYRFPPPGLGHLGQENQTGFSFGQQTVSSFGSVESIATNQQQQLRSGRPRPLTAGPPGQRYVAPGPPPSSRAGVSSVPNQLNLPSSSSWTPDYPSHAFTSVPTEFGVIRDTLPFEEVQQYYLNGFPKDMTGQYQRRHGAVGEDRPATAEETNRWFHAGVRNFNKTANDHLTDMERRVWSRDHGSSIPSPYGAVGDRLPAPLSVNEVIDMPLPDASALLLNRIFGNTLTVADQRPGPNNARAFSRFATPPAWVVDNTPQGNQSFYGEDWGRAPRRYARDPRHQPPQE